MSRGSSNLGSDTGLAQTPRGLTRPRRLTGGSPYDTPFDLPVACRLLEFGAATNSIVSVGRPDRRRNRYPLSSARGFFTDFANSGHWRVTWQREGRRSFAASGVDPGRRNAPAEVKGAVKSFPRSQGGYISSHSPQHEEQARQLVQRSPHAVESGAYRSSACRG